MRPDTLNIILENRKKHETTTDSELLDFAIQQIQNEISNQIIKAGQEILEASRTLEKMKEWIHLTQWSKHLFSSAINLIKEEFEKNPTITMKSFVKTNQFKYDIMSMSKPEILNLLNDEAKEKYFNQKGEEK